MNRRLLYIYWKVQPAQLAEALHAVRRFQAGLPGVHAAVLKRADAQADQAITLMETYGEPQGMPAAAAQALIDTSAAALAQWAQGGARHAEVFEPA